MESKQEQEFSKIRSVIFPIHKSELRKFLPISLVFFFISFNYSTLRSLKDMYIMRYTGVEVLYNLKLYAVMPYIILLTILYSKISKTVDRDTRFNIVIGYFLFFLGLSSLFFIPNLQVLQLDQLGDFLTANFPKMKGLWEAIRYWPLSLLYVHGEAWGTLVLSVLFWTFVNEITNSQQAKRFYSFLAIGASIGMLFSGIFVKLLKHTFHLQLVFVTLFTAILLVTYNVFARDIRNNPALYQVVHKPKAKKAKMSLWQSIKFLFKSSYLAHIALLVLSYNMFISLFESAWKPAIKELMELTNDPTVSATVYGDQSIYGAITSITFAFFLAAPIMGKGWRFAASFTPVVALICTMIFFAFLFFQNSLAFITDFFEITPIKVAVMVGLFNAVFIKASKYTLFDPTKERAYIPLDEESKVRGKAAVDGVGSRLGKSLGSFVLTTILIPFCGNNNIMNVRPHVFVILLGLLVTWLFVAHRLSIKFHALSAQQEQEKEGEVANVKSKE